VTWTGSGEVLVVGSCECGNEPTGWGTICFSRSTLLQAVSFLTRIGPIKLLFDRFSDQKGDISHVPCRSSNVNVDAESEFRTRYMLSLLRLQINYGQSAEQFRSSSSVNVISVRTYNNHSRTHCRSKWPLVPDIQSPPCKTSRTNFVPPFIVPILFRLPANIH
jgi:hypothetical protein